MGHYVCSSASWYQFHILGHCCGQEDMWQDYCKLLYCVSRKLEHSEMSTYEAGKNISDPILFCFIMFLAKITNISGHAIVPKIY